MGVLALPCAIKPVYGRLTDFAVAARHRAAKLVAAGNAGHFGQLCEPQQRNMR
jgi:hypothetical protein